MFIGSGIPSEFSTFLLELLAIFCLIYDCLAWIVAIFNWNLHEHAEFLFQFFKSLQKWEPLFTLQNRWKCSRIAIKDSHTKSSWGWNQFYRGRSWNCDYESEPFWGQMGSRRRLHNLWKWLLLLILLGQWIWQSKIPRQSGQIKQSKSSEWLN